MDRWAKLIATFFFMGDVPWAPGTVASFAALLLYVSLADRPAAVAAVFLAVTLLGLWAAARAEKIFGRKDPRPVVIDEVAGLFVVFCQIPLSVSALGLGFLLYRGLDIAKPFPARRLERLSGGWGIMADDLVVGVYANLVLRLLVWTKVF